MPIQRSARPDAALPPLLVRVIRAARLTSGASADRIAHDAVLRALAQWSSTRVLGCGVLAPSDDHAYSAIEKIADRHLGYAEARRTFQDALAVVDALEARDAIEVAHNRMQSLSDEAYYYAGLACGITLAQIDQPYERVADTKER